MDVIDRERLLSMCDDDPNEVREILALVAEVVLTLLARIAAGIERADVAEVSSALHELRGSTGNAGAVEVAELAGDLERTLRPEDTSSLPSCDLGPLRAAYERLLVATKTFRV